MIEPKQKTIDGHLFTVSPLPAMRQYKLLARIAKRLGPGLSKLAPLMAGKGVDLQKLDVGLLASAGASLFEALDENEAEAVLKELLETALMDGTPLMPVFNVALQGQMGTVLKLLGFGLEVNFGGFFAGLGGGGTGLLQQLLHRSAASSTSSGPLSA